jgi:hypothetical protein
MDYLQMLVLTTGSRDAAVRALDEIKALERAGWIELTDYAILGTDAQGAVRVYESACSREPANPGNSAGNPATNPEWPESVMPTAAEFAAGHVALVIVAAEPYGERVAEELEARGRTVREHLRGQECLAALRGAVERTKTNLQWLSGVVRRETEKAERLRGEEREVLESTIAAGRAELGAEQEILQARLRTLAGALEGELRENREQLRLTDGETVGEPRSAIEERIEELEHQMAACREDLVHSILDHMEALACHGAELQVKFAQASPGTADAIEAQLHELQVRMRRNRSELTATLGESSARLRQHVDQLRVEALGRPARKPDLEERINRLKESQQTVKADIRRLEREGPRAWREVTGDFRQSWQALRESVSRAERAFR